MKKKITFRFQDITWWQTFALLIQILELFTWQTEEVKSFLSFDQTSSWLPSQIFSQQDFISSLTKAASTSWVNWDFSSSAKWISQTGSNGFPLRDFSAPRSYLARLCFIPCALLCVCVCGTLLYCVCGFSYLARLCVASRRNYCDHTATTWFLLSLFLRWWWFQTICERTEYGYLGTMQFVHHMV